MNFCPNKSHPDWKYIVEKSDETTAYKLFVINGLEIPGKEFTDKYFNNSIKTNQIKPGVQELFDSNPELANQVYEALGFTSKPDVILPIGTSGSGKSTFIKSLPQENLVIIEPDAMRVEFTGDINNKSKDKEIYEEAAKRAVDAIKQGKQVVFDTTNLTKDKRLPFIEAIKKVLPNANIQYKLMELNPELAKQRIKAQIERGENRANVPDSTIDRHAGSYKQMLEDIKSEPISNFETTPQQKQQALQLYSAYLDTIFPDSQVKDIVYHLSKAEFEKFDKKFISTNTRDFDSWLGFFFTTDKTKFKELLKSRNLEWKQEYPVILNIKKIANESSILSTKFKDVQGFLEKSEAYRNYKKSLLANNYDGIISPSITGAENITIFEPEQIHILGSNQDIEGFKEFVNQTKLRKVELGTGISSDVNTQWLKDKLGMSDSEIVLVKGLIDNQALGGFMQDGKILLAEDFADDTTMYHEAFHRVFNMYASDTERNRLISEILNSPDFNTKYEKFSKIYPDLSKEELAEEILAEEFAMYAINGETEQTKSIFKQIMEFIKKLLGLDAATAKEMYERINAGYYKGTSISPEFKKRMNSVKHKKIELGGLQLTSQETLDLISGMDTIFLSNMFVENAYGLVTKSDYFQKRIKRFEFNDKIYKIEVDDKTKESIYLSLNKSGELDRKYTASEYNKIFENFIKKDALESYEGVKATVLYYIREKINNSNNLEEVKRLGEIRKAVDTNFSTLVELHKDRVKNNYKIIVDLENAKDILDASENEEGTVSRDTLSIKSSVEYDTKTGMPPIVKMLIASLSQVNSKGQVLTNSVGLPKQVDKGKITNLLLNQLAG
jgi:predicted kinase